MNILQFEPLKCIGRLLTTSANSGAPGGRRGGSEVLGRRRWTPDAQEVLR
jgi:hypothetical protein